MGIYRPGVSMRKIYEIVMVIAAAGLAAAVALIDIPTDSADPGAVIGGDKLFAAPPPTIPPTFPPLPPLLTPPGSSTPVPTDPAAATPASPLRVQPQGVTAAASASVGVLGTASVPRAPTTTTTDPPAAKPKPAETKPVKTKPKPPPPTETKPVKTKPKPPPPTETKPKGGTKSEDRRKSAPTGSSPRSRPGG
jgi:hypothetical protein